jgi:hypothetical protein
MKKILFLIFVLSSISLNAQIIIHDEKESETLIIGEGDLTTKTNSKVTKNIWKVDALGVLYGKYGATYERELFDFLSIQSSVGMTYINFAEFYLTIFSFSQEVELEGSKSSLGIGDFRRENIFNAKPGYFFNISPKVYFRADGFEGPYLGVDFTYNRYNYKEKKNFHDYNAINTNQLGGSLFWGYQAINKRMVLDFSLALGVTSNKTNLFLEDQKYNIQYLSFYYGVSLKLGRYF